MIHPRKPVWTEGLFMTPQHLQQSDLYHEALLHARMHAVAKYDWGITGCQFDDRALSAGQLKLVKCHGFFPDGIPLLRRRPRRGRDRGAPARGRLPRRDRDARRVPRGAQRARDGLQRRARSGQGRPGGALRGDGGDGARRQHRPQRHLRHLGAGEPAHPLRHRGAGRLPDPPHRPARARSHRADRGQEDVHPVRSSTSAPAST